MARARGCAVAFFALLGVALASGALTVGRASIPTARRSSGDSTAEDVERLLAIAFASARAEGANADSIARAASEDIGALFAESWARATGSVSVTENGEAAAQARASARAQAGIFGNAIAGAVADAVTGNNDAAIAVDGTQVASAIVRATAPVEIQLTRSGRLARSTTDAAARVVTQIVNTAIFDAIAFTVNDAADAGEIATNANTDAEALPGCERRALLCCRVSNACAGFSRANSGSFETVENTASGEMCKC